MLQPVKTGKVNNFPLMLAFATIARRAFPTISSVRIQFACLALLADDTVVKKAMKHLQEDTLKHRQRVTEQEKRMQQAYWRLLVNNS